MLLILTKILELFNKKLNQKNTKVSYKVSRNNKKVSQTEKYLKLRLTISKPVIDLRKKLLEGIKNNQNCIDLEEHENVQPTFEGQKHIQLLEFIKSNVRNDGKLPKESEILHAMKIKSWELKELKIKLFEEGYLIKANERVYKLKFE